MKLFSSCFCDSEIKSFIVSHFRGDKSRCPYNNIESESIDFSEVSDIFLAFFSLFVKKDDNGQELLFLLEKDWKIIDNNLKNKRLFLDDILKELHLELTSRSIVTYREEIRSIVTLWEKIKDSLRTKRRYFHEYNLEDEGWVTLLDNKMTLKEDTLLYRARINPSDKLAGPLKPEEMWAPKGDFATGGRANPQGIPYLYLCREAITTAYETRAIHLDLVSVGSFSIIQPLEIVDFCREFDPFIYDSYDDMVRLAKQMLLLRVIAEDMSKPMRRHSSDIEYIPTQYICEFIRHYIKADGVQFRSSIYAQGKNIVLFNYQDKVVCNEVKLYKVQSNKIEWSIED